jgi:hypothetical protein
VRHETSANVRSSHMECARMQSGGRHDHAASALHNHAGELAHRMRSNAAGRPARPRGERLAQARGRARMQPDGRHDRAASQAHNHAAIICAGQRKRYHAPSGSCCRRLENFQRTTTRPPLSRVLRRGSCPPAAAQHVGRSGRGFQLRPTSSTSPWRKGARAAAASLRAGLARWDCLRRSIRLRSWTALRMPPKASTMTSTACTPACKHACRTLTVVGSCGTAALQAAALARRMRSDKGNGPAVGVAIAVGVNRRVRPSRRALDSVSDCSSATRCSAAVTGISAPCPPSVAQRAPCPRATRAEKKKIKQTARATTHAEKRKFSITGKYSIPATFSGK